MTQDDYVSFKAPIQPSTITYLSLDGGKTIMLPQKGATAAGQTAQLQYPTSGDCGACSQLVEVNQNLATLNKTAGQIETWAWIIVLLLAAIVLMKILEEKE